MGCMNGVGEMFVVLAVPPAMKWRVSHHGTDAANYNVILIEYHTWNEIEHSA